MNCLCMAAWAACPSMPATPVAGHGSQLQVPIEEWRLGWTFPNNASIRSASVSGGLPQLLACEPPCSARACSRPTSAVAACLRFWCYRDARRLAPPLPTCPCFVLCRTCSAAQSSWKTPAACPLWSPRSARMPRCSTSRAGRSRSNSWPPRARSRVSGRWGGEVCLWNCCWCRLRVFQASPPPPEAAWAQLLARVKHTLNSNTNCGAGAGAAVALDAPFDVEPIEEVMFNNLLCTMVGVAPGGCSSMRRTLCCSQV